MTVSLRLSRRSILALPGNQFVVTLCNPSKVIKGNELQLQKAFKNIGGGLRGGLGRGSEEGMVEGGGVERNDNTGLEYSAADSTSQVSEMKY